MKFLSTDVIVNSLLFFITDFTQIKNTNHKQYGKFCICTEDQRIREKCSNYGCFDSVNECLSFLKEFNLIAIADNFDVHNPEHIKQISDKIENQQALDLYLYKLTNPY